MPALTKWETPNGAHHKNKHAECLGIEFCALPYQPYYARAGNTEATVSYYAWPGIWRANVYHCLPNGSSEHIDSTEGTNEEDVFSFAAKMILDRMS